MARRRSWSKGSRVAYGLSTGMSDAFRMLMQQLAQQRNAAAIGARQKDQDERTLSRMEAMERTRATNDARRSLIDQIPKISSGELSPDAFMGMMAAGGTDLLPTQTPIDEVGTGEYGREREANLNATHGFVQSLRPPMRRKLESTVGKHITGATTPEQLGESDIMGQILAADDRVRPEDDEPGMRVGGLRPEAYEYVARAEDKAHALRSRPGERLTTTNPDGSESVSTPSALDFATGPIQTKPSSVDMGKLRGAEENALLGVVGPTRAKQAGAEGFARETGAINAKLAKAKELIEFDTKQALARLEVVGREVDVRKAAEAVAEARESASRAAPAIDQLQKTWLVAQPMIAQLAGSEVLGRAALGFQESYRPSSTLPQNVKNYSDLVDAVRPLLARAFGQTGNPALMEQQWAKYVPNYSDALNPADALMKLARLEALMSSQVAIAELARTKGVLSATDIDAIIAPRIESAFEALKGMAEGMGHSLAPRPTTTPTPGTSLDLSGLDGAHFVVTPSGMRLVRPGGQ